MGLEWPGEGLSQCQGREAHGEGPVVSSVTCPQSRLCSRGAGRGCFPGISKPVHPAEPLPPEWALCSCVKQLCLENHQRILACGLGASFSEEENS